MKRNFLILCLFCFSFCAKGKLIFDASSGDIEETTQDPSQVELDRECFPKEIDCNDRIDNDCDSKVDFLDPDCGSCREEICNGVDDDCDNEVDEEVVCSLPNADSHCENGRCVIDRCHPGYLNIDGDFSNGCEAECSPQSREDKSCNGVDDDCDGRIDEDWEPQNRCGIGVCERMEECRDGRVSCVPGQPLSRDDANCNGIDDNCNGDIDEDNWDRYEINDNAPGFWLGNVSDHDLIWCDMNLWPSSDIDFFYFYNDDPMFESFHLEIFLLHLPADYNLDLFACDDNESEPTPPCNNWIYQESSTNPGLEDEHINHRGTGGINDGKRYMIKVYPAQGVLPECNIYCIRIIGT